MKASFEQPSNPPSWRPGGLLRVCNICLCLPCSLLTRLLCDVFARFSCLSPLGSNLPRDQLFLLVWHQPLPGMCPTHYGLYRASCVVACAHVACASSVRSAGGSLEDLRSLVVAVNELPFWLQIDFDEAFVERFHVDVSACDHLCLLVPLVSVCCLCVCLLPPVPDLSVLRPLVVALFRTVAELFFSSSLSRSFQKCSKNTLLRMLWLVGDADGVGCGQ